MLHSAKLFLLCILALTIIKANADNYNNHRFGFDCCHLPYQANITKEKMSEIWATLKDLQEFSMGNEVIMIYDFYIEPSYIKAYLHLLHLSKSVFIRTKGTEIDVEQDLRKLNDAHDSRPFIIVWCRTETMQIIAKQHLELKIHTVYHDYVSNSSSVGALGTWTKANGLQTRESIDTCCFNLKGAHITAVYTQGMPAIAMKEDGTYHGYCYDTLVEMASYFQFTFYVYHVQDGFYGSYDAETGTWNGMINDLIQKKADIALGDFSMTKKRKMVVDYLSGVRFGAASVAYKEEELTVTSSFAVIQTFNSTVWLILCSIIAVSCLLGANLALMNKSPSPSKGMEIVHNVFVAATIPMLQGQNFSNVRNSARMLVLVLNYLGIFLNVCYTTVLLSTIAVTLEVRPFEDITSLIYHETYRPLFFSKGIGAELLLNALPGVSPDKKDSLLRNKDNFVNDVSEGLSRVAEDRLGFIDFYQYLSWSTKDDRSLFVLQDNMFVDSWFLTMQKDSPFYHPLSFKLLKMIEGGVMNNIEALYTAHTTIDASNKELDAQFIVFPLLVLAFGLVATFFVLILETYVSSRTFNKKWTYLKTFAKRDMVHM